MNEQYPGAPTAAAVLDALKQWPMYIGYAKQHGIDALKERMRIDCQTAMERGDDPERKEVLRQALAEWDHPDFLLCLRAKLEAM